MTHSAITRSGRRAPVHPTTRWCATECLPTGETHCCATITAVV